MLNDAEAAFEVDERVCPLEAVQNAAYAFTDRAYVRVEPAGENKLKVAMTFKPQTGPEARAAVQGEFDNELLHQALRLRVSDANRKIREFIVTKALVSAQPSAAVAQAAPDAVAGSSAADCPECAAQNAPQNGAPADAAPPVDEALEKEIDRLLIEIEKGGGEADPLGVNVPWEEKFAPKDAVKADVAAKAGRKSKPKRKPS